MRPMLKTTIALAVAGMMSGAFAATTVKADKDNVQHANDCRFHPPRLH